MTRKSKGKSNFNLRNDISKGVYLAIIAVVYKFEEKLIGSPIHMG